MNLSPDSEMEYLFQVATVKRIHRMGLISMATYQQRLVSLIHEHAGVPAEGAHHG